MRPVAVFAMLALVSCKSSVRSGEPGLAAHPLPAQVRGATLRAVGDARRGYGTAKARETMERLRGLGVNTIAVLMEGRAASVSDTEVRVPDKGTVEALRAMLRDAHGMGFATVLIPHLYLDDGGWRGHVLHRDPRERDRWWASYSELIGLAAVVADDAGVSLLSIGVELKGMSSETDTRTRMRGLVERVRRDYRGPITYSANWDELEDVSFWDLVDVVGVNAYFPLVPDPVRGAEAVARRLSSFGARVERPVLVLEVGYRSSPIPHERPWEWPDAIDPVVDHEAQARAWAAVLSSWLEPLAGLIVWVIPTDPDDPASEPAHGFSPMNKPAEVIIARAFKGTT